MTRRVLAGRLATAAAGMATLVLASGCGASFAAPWAAPRQRLRRLGYLSSNPTGRGELEPFLKGLNDLGYVEGREFLLERRYEELHPERGAALVNELLALDLDVLVTEAYPATATAKEATALAHASGQRVVPVVFVLVTDPVGLGLVDSLNRPGGNLTGLSTLSPTLSAKRLELLKAIAPEATRVAVLHNPDNRSITSIVQQTEEAGHALGIAISSIRVQIPEDVDVALATALAGQPHALFPMPSTPFTIPEQRARLLQLAAQHRLITLYTDRGQVEAGFLMSVGPDYTDIFGRAALYVDKLFRGASSADLPVELPAKFDVAINVTTAQRLGLTISPDAVAQVTEWVE